MKRTLRVLFVLSLSSCAPAGADLFARDYAIGERAKHAGRYDEAARAFETAADRAANSDERDRARMMAALVYVRGQKADQALRIYDSLAQTSPPGRQAGAASYRAAMLRLGRGDEARALRELDEVTSRFPQSGIAHVALKQAIATRDRISGTTSTLAWLRGREASLHSELQPIAHYEVARHLDTAGDKSGAVAVYLQVAERWPYPHGAFHDDALFRASVLSEGLGDVEGAIAPLVALARVRETTSLMGSYQRPKMTRALLRLAWLYAEKRKDRELARKTLRKLADEYTTSTERDDALWMEADLWTAEGRESEACSVLRRLVDQFPDSRYVACATSRCSDIKRPEKSRAVKECRGYAARRAKLVSGVEAE